MRSIFKLLFSANYWRMLFRSDTWRSTWVALRRAHKDRRSWKQFAKTLYLVLVPVAVLVIIAAVSLSIAGRTGFALVWAFYLLMLLLSRLGFGKKQKRFIPRANDDNVNRAMRARPRPLFLTPELRREFGQYALLYAVLVDRAGSEIFIQTKVLPEGFTVITRQRHLQVLRENGLYDRLGEVERDLMLLPDGHWTDTAVDSALSTLEPLRVLRWVLRVDFFLPAVGATMKVDYHLAGPVVNHPDLLFKGVELIGAEALNTGIVTADHYFYRCWAEGIARGIYTADEMQKPDEAKEYAGRLKGREGEDLLLNTTIVSLATDADVRLAATLGLRRAQVLRWVRSRMYAEEPPAARFGRPYLR